MNKYMLIGGALLVLAGAYLIFAATAETTSEPIGETPEEAARQTYTNEELGFSFQYEAGTDGYVLEDDLAGFSEHPNFVHGIMLTDYKEYEALHTATDPREGPPTIQVRVYENPDHLSPAVWIDRNPLEANSDLMLEGPEEATVGGANAVVYRTDGLYAMKTYAAAHGEHLYLFVGMYLDRESAIVTDFETLVESVRFVPTAQQIGDGEQLGFIRSVAENGVARSLSFDVATWLTGVQAEEAAIRAGLCSEQTRAGCLPNGFFIENEDTTTVSVPVDGDAPVVMQTYRMEETGQVVPQEIALADFATLINDDTRHWRDLPYTLTIADGEVVRIQEVYVP